MRKVTAIGASAFYYTDAFAHILWFIASMGTVKRCPACNHCFVSEKEVFLNHLITDCNKKDMAFHSLGQIDREVERIEQLLGITPSVITTKHIVMPDIIEGYAVCIAVR